MTSIRSFSEILVAQADDADGAPDLDLERTRRFLDIIQHESVRLTRLLDEILDLNRMESGQVEWTLVETDAAAIAREAMETMRGLAQEHGVELADRLGAGGLPVAAEPDRLKQVFINLLSNGIKFQDGPGGAVALERVGVADGADRSFLEIRVRDDGPGIPEAERQTLFSKFSRGWNEHSHRRRGSGLGLAISKQIMLRLDGDLTLVESSTAGSCFAVRMRRAEAGRSGRADTSAAE